MSKLDSVADRVVDLLSFDVEPVSYCGLLESLTPVLAFKPVNYC